MASNVRGLLELAFQRHRAALPIGAAHAIAIA